MKEDIVRAIQNVLSGMGVADAVDIELERPADPAHGDFSTNVALVRFSKIKKIGNVQNPFALATLIQKKLSEDTAFMRSVKSVTAVQPGFYTSSDVIYGCDRENYKRRQFVRKSKNQKE
jgi:arginyl-tRNA synthetase